jgi:hypothetical protein
VTITPTTAVTEPSAIFKNACCSGKLNGPFTRGSAASAGMLVIRPPTAPNAITRMTRAHRVTSSPPTGRWMMSALGRRHCTTRIANAVLRARSEVTTSRLRKERES